MKKQVKRRRSSRGGLTAQKVKEIRLLHEYSRQDFAVLMGYSYGTVASIENRSLPMTIQFERRFFEIVQELESNPMKLYNVFAIAGTLHHNTTVLKSDIKCACGCGKWFVPNSWNHKYYPGHWKRKLEK